MPAGGVDDQVGVAGDGGERLEGYAEPGPLLAPGRLVGVPRPDDHVVSCPLEGLRQRPPDHAGADDRDPHGANVCLADATREGVVGRIPRVAP